MKPTNRFPMLALAVFMVLTLIMAACTTPPTAEEPQATEAPATEATEAPVEEPASDEPVELVLYTSDGVEWLTFVADEFMKQNPGIDVTVMNVAWDEFDTKMIAMNTAGTPPDIWTSWGPSGFMDYYARGLIADLTPYIEASNFDMSDFYPEVVDYFTIDGKIYGIPHTVGAAYIFYNKDMFDAVGEPYPPTDWNDTSWTWDRMLDVCSKIAYHDEADPANSTWCVSRGLYPVNTYAWLWDKDIFPQSIYETGYAEEANLSDPELLEIFQKYQDITYEYHYDQTGPEWMATGGDPFVMGKTAMQMWGVWGFDNTFTVEDFKWGVAAVPYGDPNADRKVHIYANPWMLSSQSRHPEEAWKLLAFLSSPEMHLDSLNRGTTPLARKSLMDEFYAMVPYMTAEELDEVLNGAIEHGQIAPATSIVGWGEINNVLGTAFDAIENGTDTAANSLPAFEDELIAKLKELKATYEK
ncbi:MAG: extracellular solute-binding protein [Anaerolineae bacterium]|nr:extracellular solute-binding protein [Anaerolineae bacterium]